MELDLQAVQNILTEWTLANGPSVLLALVTLVIGWYCSKLASRGIKRVMSRAHVDATVRSLVGGVIHYSLLSFFGVSALGIAGFHTTSFLALLGTAGIAIGLALQGALSNFAAGVMLITFRPFRAGDTVLLAGQRGKITAIDVLHTHLTTPDNIDISMPNSQVLSGAIQNFTKNTTRRVEVKVGVSYDADLDEVHRTLMDLITTYPNVNTDPEPAVFFVSLDDSCVSVSIRVWVDRDNYWSVFTSLTKDVKMCLDRNGIVIPYPQRTIHLQTTQTAPANLELS